METNEQLVARIQSGETALLETLWERNKRFVATIAVRYLFPDSSYDMDDLLQAGYLGLHIAAAKYSPETGAPFLALCRLYVKNQMRRAACIRGTRNDPLLNAKSLDAPLNDGVEGDMAWLDTIEAEAVPDRLEEESLQETVRAAVSRLNTANVRRAIEMVHFDEMSYEQASEREGVALDTLRSRLYRGYALLRQDPPLRDLAGECGYCVDYYQYKSVKAFKTSLSSVVEDIVLYAEKQQAKAVQTAERDNKRAALTSVLGDLV